MNSVERAVALVAQAYGIGPLLDVMDAMAPEPGPDDEYPADFGGALLIAKEAEPLEQAGRAIHPNQAKQPDWFRKLPPLERQWLLQWSEGASFRMRGRGVDYRVGEFCHWARTVGIVVVPRTRPAHLVHIAISDAGLSGPLEPWLVLVATQRIELWPKVRLYAIAAGLAPWAADEAARRIVVGQREWDRERAKHFHMRVEDYAAETRRAECKLRDWLQQAASAFLRAYETPSEMQLNYGQQSGHKPDSLWHPERESETATGGRKGGRGMSPDSSPRAPARDKAGNRSNRRAA